MRMDPGITPAQGRVLWHQERIFRSAGGNTTAAHLKYVQACQEAALPPMVDTYTVDQCVLACQLMELAARDCNLHLFRQIETGWQSLQ